MYGATPIEDIPYYNVIVRQLTEWTGTNQTNGLDQFSISDGIGGVTSGLSGQFGITAQNTGARATSDVNVRQKYIQGIDLVENITLNNTLGTGSVVTPYVPIAWDVGVSATSAGNVMGTAFAGNAALGFSGYGMVPNNNNVPLAAGTNFSGTVHPTVTGTNPVRRYQVQLALGIFNQEKLIPTKFMASQLAIEITLENPNACMYFQSSPTFTYPTAADPNANPLLTATGYGTPATVQPSYQVTNVNLIPEILEFDASYDESFLKGLQTGGVPIKFATWNNYRFSNNGVSSINLQIQERSRSVKAIFCMQRRAPETLQTDTGASFFNTAVGATSNADGNSTFQEYQFRIGGRYFPAQAVQNATNVGGKIPNGGAESYVELAKALNTLGDYRISTTVTNTRWAFNPMSTSQLTGSAHTLLSEYDFDYGLVGWKWTGSPVVNAQRSVPYHVSTIVGANGASVTTTVANPGSSRAGDIGSSCFAIAIDLETSNGLEISGLNAEEQSDISLIARWSDTQSAGFVFDVFTYIDSMIVLRENNVTLLLTIGKNKINNRF